MKVQLKSYDTILIDASFFLAPLQSELLQGLSECKNFTVRASTYRTEIAQLSVVMTDRQRKIYQQNLARLDKIPFTTLGDSHHGLNTSLDTLDIAQQLAKSKLSRGRLLLITENLFLAQRMILRGLPFDIYCPSSDTCLKKEDLATNQAHFDFHSDSSISSIVPPHRKPKLTLYTQEGKVLSLSAYVVDGDIISGNEACLYEVDNSDMLAKVFHKEISGSKIQNILQLCRLSKQGMPEWLLLPQKALYYDPDCKELAGYLEKKAKITAELNDDVLYCNLFSDFTSYASDFSRKCSETLELCLHFTRQIAYLRIFGICLTDYNLRNLSRYSPSFPWLYMWDTDSFCCGNYLSNSQTPDLAPVRYRFPENPNGRKSEVFDYSTEMLYLCILSLLTLGAAPVKIKDTARTLWILDHTVPPAPLSDYPNPTLYRAFVPSNLLELYRRIFEDGASCSIEILMQELETALKDIRQNPGKDFSYLDIITRFANGAQPVDPPNFAPSFDSTSEPEPVSPTGPMDGEDIFAIPLSPGIYEEYSHPKPQKALVVISPDPIISEPPIDEPRKPSRQRVGLLSILTAVLLAALGLLLVNLMGYSDISGYVDNCIDAISQAAAVAASWFNDLLETITSPFL